MGNKSDLGGKVSKADVNRWLQQRNYKNMVYLETSALENTNITEAFDQVARLCLKNCAQDLVYVLFIDHLHIHFFHFTTNNDAYSHLHMI